MPQVRVVDEAGTGTTRHLDLAFDGRIEVAGLTVHEVPAWVNAQTMRPWHDTRGAIFFRKLIDQPHGIDDLRFSSHTPYKIRVDTLVTVTWHCTVVIGADVLEMYTKHMSHYSKQPWVHEDGVQEAIAIHGFDHGIHDPTNPLLIGSSGTFFHYGCIVAITHFSQLILIEERTKIHVAIAVEGLFLGIRENAIVLISEAKLIHRVFYFGERQAIERLF